MNQKLSIGSIFSVKNDPRKLIVIGYGDNDMYIVCVCDDKKVETNKPYLIGQNQINKVLSLGYVYENISEEKVLNDNNQVASQGNSYKFDDNGVLISY